MGVAAVDGKIYVIGGDGGTSQENESYDPGVSTRIAGLLPNTLYSFKAKARKKPIRIARTGRTVPAAINRSLRG